MLNSLSFIYVTDLHGDIKRYNDALGAAVANNVDILHLGADLLPKGSGILDKQKKFVKGFLNDFFRRADEANVEVLCHFGNDDLYTRKKYMQHPLLDDEPYVTNGYKFSAYGYVPDYPFGLKTACKYDSLDWKPPTYISTPVDVGDTGFYPIEDIREYFAKKGTIQEDMFKLFADEFTIMSIHAPPNGLALDVCLDHRQVGSQAIAQWISVTQPKVVLCGHIHESPDVSGIWYNTIGKSVIVQPGNKKIVHVEIGNSVTLTQVGE